MANLPKSVFLTGGNRGLGFGLVKVIVQELKPQHLFVTYRNKDKAKELFDFAKANPCIHPIELDVTDFKKYPEIITTVDKTTGGAGLNLLINNAGILDWAKQSLATLDSETLMQHFLVNSIAPIMLAKAFLPLLKKATSATTAAKLPLGIGRGFILNIASYYGTNTDDPNAQLLYPYRMSKAALIIGTHSLGFEMKKENIIAISVCPGWVKTDMGGKDATNTPAQSAGGIVKVLISANDSYNGKMWNWDGKPINA